MPDGPHGDLGLLVVVVVVFLGDDDGGVGVSSEDALVPHEVVVDELAEWGAKYISSSYCSYGYSLYLFLGLTTFGAAANYSAIRFN